MMKFVFFALCLHLLHISFTFTLLSSRTSWSSQPFIAKIWINGKEILIPPDGLLEHKRLNLSLEFSTLHLNFAERVDKVEEFQCFGRGDILISLLNRVSGRVERRKKSLALFALNEHDRDHDIQIHFPEHCISGSSTMNDIIRHGMSLKIKCLDLSRVNFASDINLNLILNFRSKFDVPYLRKSSYALWNYTYSETDDNISKCDYDSPQTDFFAYDLSQAVGSEKTFFGIRSNWMRYSQICANETLYLEKKNFEFAPFSATFPPLFKTFYINGTKVLHFHADGRMEKQNLPFELSGDMLNFKFEVEKKFERPFLCFGAGEVALKALHENSEKESRETSMLFFECESQNCKFPIHSYFVDGLVRGFDNTSQLHEKEMTFYLECNDQTILTSNPVVKEKISIIFKVPISQPLKRKEFLRRLGSHSRTKEIVNASEFAVVEIGTNGILDNVNFGRRAVSGHTSYRLIPFALSKGDYAFFSYQRSAEASDKQMQKMIEGFKDLEWSQAEEAEMHKNVYSLLKEYQENSVVEES